MQQKTKKITFLSIVLFTVGSTIGSGIFIKNSTILKYNQGELLGTSLSWILALVAFFALALTLVEVCQGAKEENANGIPGWCKTYNNNFFAKAAKNFTLWIYLPTNYFFMPLYAIDQISESTGWDIPWWAGITIGLALTFYFILTSGRSAHISAIQNNVITSVKFIPLVFCCIIGFVALGMNKEIVDHTSIEKSASYFINLAPILGIGLSIPAIFFSFDGFYCSTSLYDKLEKKNAFTKGMIVGLLIVSVIYIFCSISLILLNIDGSLEEGELVPNWLSIILNICITIGIFGILNGFSFYGTMIFYDAIKNGEIFFSKKLQKYTTNENTNVGMYYSLTVCTIFFIIYSVIGCFFYDDYQIYAPTDSTNIVFGQILTACDALSNWSSLIIFLFITCAGIGCATKRNNPKFGIKKTWYFFPCIIISSIFCIGCFGLICTQTVYDLTFYLVVENNKSLEKLLNYITPLIILLIYTLATIIPSVWYKKEKSVALKK